MMPLPEKFVQEIKEYLNNKKPIFVISPNKKEIKPIERKIKNKFKNEKLNKVVVDVFENLQKRYVEGMVLVKYDNELIYSNPLLEKIINEIKKFDETNMLIFVVSPKNSYSKFIKKEIDKKLKNKMKASIIVGSWKYKYLGN